MTFSNTNTSGSFRISRDQVGEGYATCHTCKGLYFYEGTGWGIQGLLGSQVSRGIPPFISATQRLVAAKESRDRELLQNHLRYQFFNQTTHCTCNPENDRLFLQTRITETLAKLQKPKDISADLEILDDLLNRGVLTRDQYDVAKRKLLSSYPFSSSAAELMWRRVKKLFDQFTRGIRRS